MGQNLASRLLPVFAEEVFLALLRNYLLVGWRFLNGALFTF